MKKLWFHIAFLISLSSSYAQRQVVTINSDWIFNRVGQEARTVNLPHTYNAEDAFDDEPSYYRGKAVYQKVIRSEKLDRNQKHFLRFGAVNQEATVYVNSQLVGSHQGGYTSFTLDIPPDMMEPEEPFVWAETMDLETFINTYDDGVVGDENIIFSGQVSSTDEFGNIDGLMYVTRGDNSIAIALEEDNFFERYSLGSEVLILASGLTYSEGADGNRLVLADGLTLADEETYISFVRERLEPNGRSVSDISALTADWIGSYVRVSSVQFDEEDAGKPLSDGLALRKSDGSFVRVKVEPGAKLVDEVPYGSGTIKGILEQDGSGDWTVRPMKPTDLSLNGTRHSLFQQTTYEQDGFTLPYQIMYPKDYDESKAYPLIIFLHGAGERGTNNTSQMANGPNTFANREAREQYPAIVVFPQCPGNYMWSRRTKETGSGQAIFTFPVEQEPDVPLKAVIQMTRDFIADGIADAERIYVMGLSMGGIGTLEYCYYAPDLPAAAISLAGGHDGDIAFTYGEQVSIRLYAGANDGVVPSVYSKEVYDAIRFLPGGDIEFYEDPDRGHEWNYVLNDPTQVLPWIWQKTK